MATEKRIEDLRAFCKQAKESLEEVEARKDQLLEWKSMGMSVFEKDKDGDQFPSLIEDADRAVIAYQKISTYLRSSLDRAIAGEDV